MNYPIWLRFLVGIILIIIAMHFFIIPAMVDDLCRVIGNTIDKSFEEIK